MTALATAEMEAGRKTGKYLAFALGKEEYALEILKVREIVGMMEITPVPRMPKFIRGVVNLRGRVIPVIDLRAKLGMPLGEGNSRTCIIVVCVGEAETGIVVDKVWEVLDISGEDIEDIPSVSASADTGFILGLAKTGQRITILLDIARILAEADVVGPGDLGRSTAADNSPRIEQENNGRFPSA